ncbi:MAG: hypothetical protein JSV62_07895 [Promethearchaeota archaeon]|nr:MAG: hypothetical protein JSV62_07895 [Candidatus Lokiarchaeota archaeon]
MFILDLKNNLQNIDYFKRLVRGARLNRGKNIPNKNIINFNVESDPNIRIIADIQGSGTSRYVINILQEFNGRFKIIHDCPDFRKGFRFCKHIVKIFLLIEPGICKSICSDYHSIIYSSDFSLVKESKSKSFLLKAEDLIQEAKYYEAINFLDQAFQESRNFDYILRIGEISLKYNLYDLFLNYVVKYKELANKNLDNLPKIIIAALSCLKNYSFSKKVEIVINIQKILVNLSRDHLIETLQKSKIHELDNPILKYLLLNNLDSKIYIRDHFKDILTDSKKDLKTVIEEKALQLVDESILNMESEEIIDSYAKMMTICKFNNYNLINTKIQEYKHQLRKIYIEGLKSKHAFLRFLVIANTHSDKLRQMKFTQRYNYPSLIWGSAFKSESPLHYYILEKCGYEKHHLEYTEVNNFIENYPVFAEIFTANNPIRYEIKNFWGSFEPKIMNIVKKDSIIELDFKVSTQDIEKFTLVEWDLAQKPILGSYICQFSDGYLIPDKTHPLTHYIQPFDLILCEKKPVAIKSNNIKIMKPLRRINIKSAIELVWEGIEYISSYLPLKIIDDLRNFRIDELDAIEKVYEIFTNSFLPEKEGSKKYFHDFIQSKIVKELNKTYLRMINKPNYKDKVLKMIGFERYSQIFTKKTTLQDFRGDDLKRTSLQELKHDFKKKISKKLSDLIKNQEFDAIDLKILKKFPKFRKWTLKLIYELKKQLLNCEIFQIDDNSYNIQNLIDNYYGEIIVQSALNANSKNNKLDNVISKEDLAKILENFNFLKLTIPKIIKKAI